MIHIDPTLPHDVQVLIKATWHLVQKAYPSGHRISVPVREFQRVASKVKLLTAVEGEADNG